MAVLFTKRKKKRQGALVCVEGTIERTISVRPYAPPLYRRFFWLIASVLLLAPSLAYAIWGSTATIHVTLTTSFRRQTVTVPVVSHPSLPSESLLRQLMATQTQTLRIPASGVIHHAATQAHGLLTWYNQLAQAQTIPGGTTLALSSTLQLVTESTFTVPAAIPPTFGQISAPAHMLQSGTQGNLAAGSIALQCGCADAHGLTATNPAAFTGGQDETTQRVLEQQDVDQVVAQHQPLLSQQASEALRNQLTAHDHLSSALECRMQTNVTPAIGSTTDQAQIVLNAICQAESYNSDDVQSKAAALFREQTQPATGYLLDKLHTNVIGTTSTKQGLLLSVQVEGQWSYPVSRQQWERFRSQLAGLTPDQAKTLLTDHVKAIKTITVEHLWFWLPNDPQRIILVPNQE